MLNRAGVTFRDGRGEGLDGFIEDGCEGHDEEDVE